MFISVVFTQLLPRTPNHFPLPRHWTRDRDFGPATATLDPRPRPLDPRPATVSQTPAFCTQPSYCMHSAFRGLRFTLTSWTSPLKFRPLMSSEKAFWRWRAFVLKRPVQSTGNLKFNRKPPICLSFWVFYCYIVTRPPFSFFPVTKAFLCHW